MHEVLSGNSYRPQVESVPEQTWSSAGYLEATIHGLLGLSVDSAANRIAFAPHLPAQWNSISVEHIKLSHATIDIVLRRTPHKLTLEIDNSGAPGKLEFSPQLPLGSRIGRAELDHKPIAATLEAHPQETDARVSLDAPHGKSELTLDVQDGVSVIVDSPAPRLGMSGSGLHLVGVNLEGNVLTIVADVPSDRESHLQLQTEWEVTKADGARVQPLGVGHIDLIFTGGQDAALSEPYHRAKAVLQFKP